MLKLSRYKTQELYYEVLGKSCKTSLKKYEDLKELIWVHAHWSTMEAK